MEKYEEEMRRVKAAHDAYQEQRKLEEVAAQENRKQQEEDAAQAEITLNHALESHGVSKVDTAANSPMSVRKDQQATLPASEIPTRILSAKAAEIIPAASKKDCCTII